MDYGLKGKTAIVTGGATGIGEAAAFRFLAEGCNVAVCGRRQAVLDAFIKKANDMGYDNVFAKSVDVTTEDGIFCFTDEVAKKFGAVDIVVNNAGGGLGGPLMERSGEDWEKVLQLNLLSTWRGAKAAYPYMKGRGGAICNVSAYSALHPMAGNGLYSVVKAAINSLTVVLAAELGKDNIRVNAVCPGRIETAMTAKAHLEDEKFYKDPIALARWGSPDEVARGIVYLCSDASSYITGDLLVITGGKFLVQNQARFDGR